MENLCIYSQGWILPASVCPECTEEGARSVCGVADSGNGGYCPINLCNHAEHGLPSFSVHVVAFVTEGAFGRPALFDFAEGGTVS
jgi:hypothetical protein